MTLCSNILLGVFFSTCASVPESLVLRHSVSAIQLPSDADSVSGLMSIGMILSHIWDRTHLRYRLIIILLQEFKPFTYDQVYLNKGK